MSSRTAAARKRLQDPLLRAHPVERANQPNISAPTTTTRADLIPSGPSIREATNVPHLDLSTEFSHPPPSPEYSPSSYFPPSKSKNIESTYPVQPVLSHVPSSHGQPSSKSKRIGPDRVTHTAPSSPYDDDIHRRRPLLRVDPHVMNYQSLPPPPNPRLLSVKPTSRATGSFPYVPDLPIPLKYPPTLTNHPGPSNVPHYLRRSNRHSLTPSELPEYRSIYSSHMDSHSPVTSTNLDSPSASTWRDNQYTSYQHPSASESKSSLVPVQLVTSPSIPSPSNESRFPLSPSSSGSHEYPDDSATSISGVSESSHGTWLPPPPPPSPNFFFPGSRSVARPRASKIAISQFKKRKSKSRLRPNTSPTLSPSNSPVGDTLCVSPTDQPPISSHLPHIWPSGAFVLSNDYKRKPASSVPKAPSEIPVFPTARSRAQPKNLSSRSRPTQLLKSGDDNHGRSRFIETLFKRKSKARPPNITPIPNTYTSTSSSVASAVSSPTESTTCKEKRISTGSTNRESTSTGQTRRMKSKKGSYPLDPYNSVLLDNDRLTGELLSRVNPTGSPSFHDYGDTPPSSVLDLGCGQGHWVLEAAITWKTYGTHVTGFDMVDISRSLVPWAAEQGVRDNIRFVRGNFLKQALPFSSNTFDLVRMSCLALCITSDSWGFILQEVCRVLMAGGRLELIDDQMFFPYGKMSSLMMDDTESAAPKLDFVLSPMISTYSVCGDVVANPGLGSTVGHRGSDDEDDGSEFDGDVGALHGRKGKVTAVQPRIRPSIILNPEAWERCASISEDLEALFEHMLLDAFDIHKDPSDFILTLMQRVFGQAREVETMNLVLAPPIHTTAKYEHSPQQGLSHCPGLILWPSTFIPMDHTEVEIHASKHLRTLLSCKNFLIQHATEVAEDERVDEEFVSEALWEYESFLGHRFNPPVPSGEHSEEGESDTTSIRSSIAESTNEAMWEIQYEFRQRYAWQPERPRDTSEDDRPPSPSASASGSSATPNELTHVRTFRVYEAVKLDNYILTYDTH